MRFASPEWFILVPLLVLAGWYWRALRLHAPLRFICLALVVLLLARPQIRRLSDGLDLWVLVDRSESAEPSLGPRLDEWQSIIERGKGARDRVNYVEFASEAMVRGAGDARVYAGQKSRTQLASAIRFALAQADGSRAARLLALTDGYSTEPLGDLAERLVKQEIALDHRLARAGGGNDWRILRLAIPRRAQVGEPLLIDIAVAGENGAKIPVEIFSDGQSLGRNEVSIERGTGTLRVTDRLVSPGAHRYEVAIIATNDPVPGNNRASQWVEIEHGPRVLMLTNYESDPAALALRAQGFQIELIADATKADPGRLSGARLVFINNVPAYKLPPDFLAALDFYVNHQGGGLLMAGGKFSFGSGGYFRSTVDALLPVSMELKKEQRKLAVALAIVLDRSGSMAASVPGTSLKKMDLADAGAASAIELLSDMDFATVFAVDSAAHEVAPLISVGKNRVELADACRRIQSAGGGIFVYTGLKAAWENLRKSEVGQRHIILFADAADAEEPGEYKALLEEMTKAKATVSVIGMGTDKDSDAAFLQDVARLGGGRIFFNANASELPALFAQETVAVARSAFVEEAATLKNQAGWLELAAKPMPWLAQVDGYNLSYLKPGATQAAMSGDEYAAPLVSFWQRGAGRTAAVSFPLGGDFSGRARQWPQYGDFLQSLARWLMGDETPPGIGIRTTLEGAELRTDLFYDETWNDKITRDAPMLAINRNLGKTAEPIPWERLAPGHYRATITLEGDDSIRGVVSIGKATFPFGPVNAVVNPEWNFDEARVEELRRVSAQSGGTERTDLTDVWRAKRPDAWGELTLWLGIALIIALLLEALQTRTGYGVKAPARG